MTIEYTPSVVTLEGKIASVSNYYGLIIGIDSYDDETIQDLDHPIRDAEKMYNSLTENYLFNHFNTRLLKNPTREEIINEFDYLAEIVTPVDNVLIFYAGHGDYDEKTEIGYWLPSNGTNESKAKWLRNSTLIDYFELINSKHTLLISDACFAGTIFKSRSRNMEVDNAFERIYDKRSRKAMTSASNTEVSDKSEFIKYLILTLNENDETYLSARMLFDDIYMSVASNSKSLPLYNTIQNVGDEGGDFIFLRRK